MPRLALMSTFCLKHPISKTLSCLFVFAVSVHVSELEQNMLNTIVSYTLDFGCFTDCLVLPYFGQPSNSITC